MVKSTASCRITIPSVRLDVPVHSLRQTVSTGGKRRLSLLIPIPLRTFGHELKEYIRREVKPSTECELVDGMLELWKTVHATKCRKYIGHLKKVMPKVMEVQGQASGY